MDFGRSKKKIMTRSLVSPAVGLLRIRWGRDESRRMLSHLDNIKIVESAIKESKFPVAYTQGVKPRMKLSFCPPLPMGFTSEAEYTDITLDQNCTGEMIEKIRASFRDGFDLLEAKTAYVKAISLSDSINRAVYVLKLEKGTNLSELIQKVSNVLERENIPINRKTKSGESVVDIRQAIFEILVSNDELIMTLGIGSGGYARPNEVIRLLFDYDEAKIAALPFHRREMYRITQNNQRIEGIEL